MIHHRWDISPRQAMALQRRLAGSVSVRPLAQPVRTVAGADCAALDDRTIVCAAVLCDARTRAILGASVEVRKCRFPYVPGLLSFREAPAVIAAVAKLPHRPDLLMIDGQGVAHPRRAGLASHVGLWLGVPTIGVAKSRLCGQHRPVGLRRGSRSRLVDAGETIGCVLRTRDGVKPLCVSVGNRITLEEARRWVLRCTRRRVWAATRRGGGPFRLPEPTRQAHLLVNRIVVALKTGGGALPTYPDVHRDFGLPVPAAILRGGGPEVLAGRRARP